MSDGIEKPKLPSDDDIQARFERIRDELKNTELPDLPDETIEKLQPRVPHLDIDENQIDAKLSHFEERMRNAKGKYETAYNKEPAKLADRQKDSHGLGVGLLIAYTIMGMPLAGAAIGWLVDKLFHSTAFVSVFGLTGAFVGVVVAIFMIKNANRSL